MVFPTMKLLLLQKMGRSVHSAQLTTLYIRTTGMPDVPGPPGQSRGDGEGGQSRTRRPQEDEREGRHQQRGAKGKQRFLSILQTL